MNFTLESLMQAAGCAKWPDTWQGYFAEAMAEYDRQGCFLANEAFYDDLQAKYGCFPKNLEVFKAAARQTATDEVLGRFLTLLALITKDRANIKQNIKGFARPVPPVGKEPLGYNMVCGLALCGVIEYAANLMQSRKIPQRFIDENLRAIDGVIDGFKKRYNGQLGFDLFDWCQRYIDCVLFYFDGLGLELIERSPERKGCVYQNAAGEQVILARDVKIHRSGYALGSAGCLDEDGSFDAQIEETNTHYIGHPVLADGRTDRSLVELKKEEWQLLLGPETPVLGLHISRGTDFSPAYVEQRLEQMCQFADQHFPDFKSRIFTCISWLLDPQMQSFLSENSNIVQFQKRFRYLPRVCNGKGVFFFIYSIPNEQEPDLDALEVKSSLQKGVVNHYKAGKYIYELPGYFLARPVKPHEVQ